VEVQLELDELGILTWLFRLPQEFVPSVQPNTANTPGNDQENDKQDDGHDPGEDDG
jgi:hypothetical protein